MSKKQITSHKKLPGPGTKKNQASLSGLLKPGKASGTSALVGLRRVSRPGASHELRSLEFSGGGNTNTGLNFGVAPRHTVSTGSTGSSWTTLVKQVASGGISGAVGGGLLKAIGGLGGLVSGIAGLFGGSKKTPNPLPSFGLPSSKNEVVAFHRQSSERPPGSADSSFATNSPSGSSLNVETRKGAPLVGGGAYTHQTQQIAQAVKQALLHSSSLNDIIAEI